MGASDGMRLHDLRDTLAVSAALEENFCRKIACLPEQSPSMHVRRDGDVVCVDTGVPSDTFNCVFGGSFADADSAGIAARVHAYYAGRGLPMAWWVGPSSPATLRAGILRHAGFVHNETEVGMVARLPSIKVDVHVPMELRIEPVSTVARVRDFARILASVFTPEDVHVPRFYEQVAPHIVAPSCPAELFVGYVAGRPVTIGGMFSSPRIAGIYDIATHPDYRRRGYGRVMIATALQAAQATGHSVVGLQASADGVRIYETLGFRAVCHFEVYGMAAATYPGARSLPARA